MTTQAVILLHSVVAEDVIVLVELLITVVETKVEVAHISASFDSQFVGSSSGATG